MSLHLIIPKLKLEKLNTKLGDFWLICTRERSLWNTMQKKKKSLLAMAQHFSQRKTKKFKENILKMVIVFLWSLWIFPKLMISIMKTPQWTLILEVIHSFTMCQLRLSMKFKILLFPSVVSKRNLSKKLLKNLNERIFLIFIRIDIYICN